jgi:hypothetical protein
MDHETKEAGTDLAVEGAEEVLNPGHVPILNTVLHGSEAASEYAEAIEAERDGRGAEVDRHLAKAYTQSIYAIPTIGVGVSLGNAAYHAMTGDSLENVIYDGCFGGDPADTDHNGYDNQPHIGYQTEEGRTVPTYVPSRDEETGDFVCSGEPEPTVPAAGTPAFTEYWHAKYGEQTTAEKMFGPKE